MKAELGGAAQAGGERGQLVRASGSNSDSGGWSQRRGAANDDEERLGWGSLAEPDSRGQKAASSNNIGGTSGSGSQSSACSSSTGGGNGSEFDCTLGYRGQDLRAGSNSHNQIGIGGGSGNGTAVLAAETAADEATDIDGSTVPASGNSCGTSGTEG